MNNVRPTSSVRLLSALFCVLLIAGGALPASASGSSARETRSAAPAAVPSEILVRFTQGNSAGARRVPSHVGRLVPGTALGGVRKIRVAPGVSVDEALAELRARSDVEYAEPNHIVSAQVSNPNDPLFANQWGLSQIDAPEAWDVERGSSDVVLAVIDTGVDRAHPALASNLWTNTDEIPANGIDDDRNGYVDDTSGWDIAAGDNDPSDTEGHGTHVAGIAAATGNDGIGTAGTAWDASVMPVRALDDAGTGTTFGIARAIDYAVANGARIVNLSLGGDGYSQTLATAITSAQDTLFVVSAGNGGTDGTGDDTSVQPSFPCNLPAANLICVAASDTSDSLTTFSNYGDSVDLAAPGRAILSTYPSNRYTYASGTSMATPFVTGAAALVMANDPTLSVTAVKTAILDGVEAVPALQGKVASGGRLSLPGALGLQDPPPDPTPTPTQEPTPEPTPTDSGDGGSGGSGGGGGGLPLPEPTSVPVPDPLDPSPDPSPSPVPDPALEPTPSPSPSASPEPVDEPKEQASDLSFSLLKKRAAIKVRGLLTPGAGGAVDVTLARRKDGRFRPVAERTSSLQLLSSEEASFLTRFNRPRRGRCRITATLQQGGDTLTVRRFFNC